jgi:hypothetical protein
MNIIINHALFNTTIFDSGALGALTSVVHSFPKPGVYEIQIANGGLAASQIKFEVSDKSEEMQLTFDLSESNSHQASSECHCVESTKSAIPQVSPKGMVLFHASKGTDYSATVKDETGKVVFDSQKLNKGDLFALSLFEPTSYSMKNTLGKATGEIQVTFTEKDKIRIRSLETQIVETFTDSFKPNSLSVVSTQGIVFQVMEAARIVIQKKAHRSDGSKARSKDPRRIKFK